MIIQKLPGEIVENDYIGTDLDTFIFRVNVPANWTGYLSFSARYAGYNNSYVESINESALLVGSRTAEPTNKFTFSYTQDSRNIYLTEGEHYIKVYKLTGFNGISFGTLDLPMFTVFGNPKYIYRTCSSWVGIGNILVNNLPFDAVNYKLNDIGSNPGIVGSRILMHYGKCSDLAKLINSVIISPDYNGSLYFTQGSDITGNIVCMQNKNCNKFYIANTKIYGDIANIGGCTNLIGNTTGDPAIYAQNCGVSGTVESLAQALFESGKTSGSIMCQFSGSNVTYEGNLVGNVLITFTEDGYTITLP